MINNILLNLSYLECGREFPNIDCYGLVLYVRKLKGMPELPELGIAKKIGGNIDKHGKPLASNLQKCEPCDGCIAACYDASGAMIHTGVVIEDAGLKVLECNPRHNATCMSVARFTRRFSKVEFYK